MGKLPIVTVIVYSYNSSQYIFETLESIRNQTYPSLMLIISDDCSTDNTVEICKKWIDKNESRFIKTKLLTYEKNTGISMISITELMFLQPLQELHILL